MRLMRTWFLLILGFGWLSYGGEAQASPPSAGLTPEINVFADGIQVSWQSPEPSFVVQADRRVRVEIDGYVTTGKPGIPNVPTTAELIALPPGSNPTLEIISVNSRILELPGPLALNPEPLGVIRNASDEIIGGDYAAATQSIEFNPNVVELEIVGVLRGVKLARLVFYPVLPDGDGIRFTTQVTARLNYGVIIDLNQNRDHAASADVMVNVVRDKVVNPEHVQAEAQSFSQSEKDAAIINDASEVAIIEVTETGITVITYEALAAIGFPVDAVNPLNFKLTHAGSEVALDWSGDWDTVFESGEYYKFYADPRPSRWADFDTYILTENSVGVRSRMLAQSADPTGLLLGEAYTKKLAEENKVYTPDCLCATTPVGWDGDRWAWDAFNKVDSLTKSYTVNLPSVNTSQAGAVTLYMISYTDTRSNPDHSVSAYLNTSLLSPATVQWNGKRAIETALTVPTGGYKIGDNVLTVSLAGLPSENVEGMWLDAFWLEYALGSQSVGNAVGFKSETTQRRYEITLDNLTNLRAYDVTNPATPKVLTNLTNTGNTVKLGDPSGEGNFEYYVTNQNGLHSPPIRLKEEPSSQAGGFLGADYIIITHQDFSAALTDLVNLRESQGLDVLVEDVQGIYDDYDDGRPTPDAIRSFLQDAYDHWNPKPTYVLLIGDGTSDPKKYQDSFNTFIPPYLAAVDPWAGETAADNRFVTLDGDDILPDMLIGRLPVNTLTEAQTVIAKIVGYETSPPSGDWTSSVAFIADDADSAGDFPGDSDWVANHYIPVDYSTDKVYHVKGFTSSETKTAILNTWNAGQALLTYMGHGSQHTWAAESIIHITDTATLTNGSKLPVVLELTCYTGSFQTPGLHALDEQMLRVANGGAVAVWGPTGLGLSRGHIDLAEGFMDEVFNQNQPYLGLAVLAGKQNLASTIPAYSDMIDTFTLFGDPAQVLQLSKKVIIYLPLIFR